MPKNEACIADLIVHKHWVFRFFSVFKFMFLCVIALVCIWIGFLYEDTWWLELVHYGITPLGLIVLNYACFRLIAWLVEYYSYMFIVSGDQIFIVNSSLILKDDVEVIEAAKIIKIDAYSHGLMANIFSYGKIIIELQTREERVFRFMPRPYEVLKALQTQRECFLGTTDSPQPITI